MELQGDETIMFEGGSAVLTEQRLLANREAPGAGRPTDQAWLKDIASYRKLDGGQYSRLKLGLLSTAVGAVLILLQFATPGLPRLVESIVFLMGASSGVFGLYIISANPFRIKPHTIVWFQVPEGTDLAATFPGHANPDADELTRLFVRAKRGL